MEKIRGFRVEVKTPVHHGASVMYRRTGYFFNGLNKCPNPQVAGEYWFHDSPEGENEALIVINEFIDYCNRHPGTPETYGVRYKEFDESEIIYSDKYQFVVNCYPELLHVDKGVVKC